jgi:hypothetical protein
MAFLNTLTDSLFAMDVGVLKNLQKTVTSPIPRMY